MHCHERHTLSGALVGVLRNLRVIYFEIRRKADLRILEQGHVATSGDCQDEGRCIMRLEFVGCQAGGYPEITDSASERGRLPGRERIDLDPLRRSGYPLADGLVFILEEAVEYAVGRT